MKKLIPLGLLIFLFLTIKIANNGVRLSDTNIYFNIAYQITQGKILYKDIFFSNFPFFSYVASVYYFLSGMNLNLFFFTSAIEITAITALIYFIVYRETKSRLTSLVSSALYLLSFIVLSTSDHQTGVFTASLAAVLSYLFFKKKKIIISGILIAIALLTKAYFIPIFLAFLAYYAIKKDWKNLLRYSASSALTGLIILLPSLIIAPRQLISDIFGFSLSRPAGLSKLAIMWFFITKDFPLFALLTFNLLNIRKNLYFGLISIFSIVFFFGYQDVYYLYLNFLTPFLALSLYEAVNLLKNKFHLQRLVLPTILGIFMLVNLITYMSSYSSLGKITEFNEILSTIVAQKPNFLYGANVITPALIALTKIPALDNVNDAHEYFFVRGVYDRKTLTDKAVNSKTIIITQGANYPDYNIRQDILDNIFIKETIYNNCKIILSVPVQTEGDANRINLFKCY